MNEEIIPAETPVADEELASLVGAFLEGELTKEDKLRLEHRLGIEGSAQIYLADRIRLHAELQEALQPVRVEMIQKRQIVFEYKRGLPRVSARQTQVTRIGNPKTDKFIEISPNAGFRAQRSIYYTLGLMLLIAVAGIIFLLTRTPDTQLPPPAASPVLSLRNAGFEESDLASDEDAFSHALLDWQDHFISENAGVCDLVRYSKYGNLAHTGKNVALLKARGYLTQRLKFSDGTPLIAQQGLHVRIRGWVLVEERNWRVPLRIALRIVKDVKPEMLQYEPCVESVEFSGGEWREFEVDFVLTKENCNLSPSDVDNPQKKYPELDITGSPLTLSLDNRSEGIFYVDDLSIEIVDKSP